MANKMTGQISVVDPVQALALLTPIITPLDTYSDTTDYVVDVRGMKSKRLLVKNSHGGAFVVTYLVESSIDNEATWDIVVQAATDVAAGATSVLNNDDYCTHWRIRVLNKVAGNAPPTQLKLVAIGV